MLLFFLVEKNQLFKFHPSALLNLFFVLKKTHIMSLVKRMIISFLRNHLATYLLYFFYLQVTCMSLLEHKPGLSGKWTPLRALTEQPGQWLVQVSRRSALE